MAGAKKNPMARAPMEKRTGTMPAPPKAAGPKVPNRTPKPVRKAGGRI